LTSGGGLQSCIPVGIASEPAADTLKLVLIPAIVFGHNGLLAGGRGWIPASSVAGEKRHDAEHPP
jgi:hypothetical protein